MNRLLTFLLCISLTMAPVSAQAEQSPQRTHPGRAKIWIGAALIGTGVLVIPLSAAASEHTRYSHSEVIGFSLISAGGVMLWWGFSDRRKASRPQTNLGVTLGRTTSVQLRCVW